MGSDRIAMRLPMAPTQTAIQRAVDKRIRRGILRVLIARGSRPATPNEMAQLFDVTPTQVFNEVIELVRTGAIELVGAGEEVPGRRLYKMNPAWTRDPATRAALGQALEPKRQSTSPGFAG